MKEVKVTVLSLSRLELQEPADKNDIINLEHLTKVDTGLISSLIEKEKREELDKRIQKERENFEKEARAREDALKATHEKELLDVKTKLTDGNQKTIDELRTQIQALKTQLEIANEKKASDEDALKARLDKEYAEEILNLKNNIDRLNEMHAQEEKANQEKHDQEKKLIEANARNTYEPKIQKLENDLETLRKTLEAQKQADIQKTVNDYTLKLNDLQNQLNLEKQKSEADLLKKDQEANMKIEDYKDKYTTLQIQYEELNRRKASLSVKMIGENLESWCNNEYHAAESLGAFDNCTWEKDNLLVKNDDETGYGTKADYIFKAYAGDKDDKFLVTSACLDMKSENPDSTTKKKNADHYKKLDSDRTKKGCEYAILVSELEMKSDNDIPVFKVNDYPNMYVVRPAYFLTFLGILMNLGKKYRYLIEAKAREDEKFKTGQQVQQDFEAFKDTYLNKPLQALETRVIRIRNDADDISKKAENIKTTADDIIHNTLETMKAKIDTLSVKLPKLEKKIDTLQ